MDVKRKRFIKGFLIFVVAAFVLVGSGLIVHFVTANKLVELVIVEAGIETLDVSEFIKKEKTQGIFATDLSSIDFNQPGVYDIEIQVKKRIYPSRLEIRDTVPPNGEAVNHEIWLTEEKEAEDFVNNIVDATDVLVSFKERPDFSKTGIQKVVIVLEDTSGNKTEIKSILNIKADTEAPVIHGATDQTVYIGDTISYRKDVVVTDNRDDNIELIIDSSDVNIKKAGTYEVIYSATDLAGNTATQTITVTVKEKPLDLINEQDLYFLAEEVLDLIITPDMTEVEKAWEIYKWTRKHIRYSNSSDKTNWVREAYRGIKQGTGDCFTYYAVSRALLTEAGFNNVRIDRSTRNFHAWNLVEVDGKWYHFDATRSNSNHPYVCFLRTDAEVNAYSKRYRQYYKFDKNNEDYPARATEPLKHHRKL